MHRISLFDVDKYISNLFLHVHCATTCPGFTVPYMTNIWTRLKPDRNPVHTFYVTWGQTANLQWLIYTSVSAVKFQNHVFDLSILANPTYCHGMRLLDIKREWVLTWNINVLVCIWREVYLVYVKTGDKVTVVICQQVELVSLTVLRTFLIIYKTGIKSLTQTQTF